MIISVSFLSICKFVSIFILFITLFSCLEISFLKSDEKIISGGTVFLTNAAKGVARETAIKLASLGIHVLVGVKSESESRSFVFDARGKGLETILFDSRQPSLIGTFLFPLIDFIVIFYALNKYYSSQCSFSNKKVACGTRSTIKSSCY
jgi:hypothetical protein